MPVNSVHPEYAKMQARWRKCRAAIAGEDAIKDGAELFLPRLSGQEDDDYTAYKTRATYFNATGRTIDTFFGMLFRVPPVIKVSSELGKLLDDITGKGESINDLIRSAAGEALSVGRAGLLVDSPSMDRPIDSLAEFEQAGLRPYIALYKAEDIINWRVTKSGAQSYLSLLVLREQAEEYKDEFESESIEVYRVLKLQAEGVSGSLWKLNEKKEWVQIQVYTLKQPSGEPLSFIPFVFVDPVDGTPSIDSPPFLDLVNINLAHYRNAADYENGLHLSGLPTPVFIGDFVSENPDEDVKEVTLGSSTGIHLRENGDAKYLEFSGQGLGSIKEAMIEKRDQMAMLGARAIAGEKAGVEAAQTAQIYRAGETSTLAAIANAVSKQVKRALGMICRWQGWPEDIEVQINTDYLVSRLSAQDLTALMALVQGAKLPIRDYFRSLQRGGIIDPERSFDDFEAEIDYGAPGAINANAE